MKETLCRTHGLTIGYRFPRRPTHVVASDLEMALNRGELTCLLGPNGAGKSTLLKTLSGTQPPISGNISLNNRDLKSYSQRELSRLLSVVLTDRIDVGFLSSYALVALGRHPYTGWSGRINSRDDEIVRWALKSVGADDLTQRFVAELSDGERQKILIARALAQEPQIMLLDEPTAFLDVPRRVEIMQLLKKLARDTGKAILLSIHDLELALRSADRICLLSMKGRLQAGVPEDLVLQGAFEETFHSEGVRFDREYGHFTITEVRGRTVSVEGSGVSAGWTKRALERVGFSVSDAKNRAQARILVVSNKNGLCWKLNVHKRESEHHSIEELLTCIHTELQE